MLPIVHRAVQDLETDEELANVATVSAGNNASIGDMICLAMQKVGRQGVVTMEESRTAEDHLNVVEGMQVGCTSACSVCYRHVVPVGHVLFGLRGAIVWAHRRNREGDMVQLLCFPVECMRLWIWRISRAILCSLTEGSYHHTL